MSFMRKVASPHELIKNRPTFSSNFGKTNGVLIRSMGFDLQSEFVSSLTVPSKLIKAVTDSVVNSGYLYQNQIITVNRITNELI